ncbi:NmrA family NAD(P)-binding protein [Halosquirtibacter xylanolyticus]|uniref:NmrA family NAD(P)-binding protein n=1 Tax=Halosquirtibacter xylanolyticus TaxID=3374599 RepID=UPI00374A28CA|nr:NmrA family NAD(P)-binding protein [Prolixibacteraceae bacterium]
MRENILITGSTGFFGRHLLSQCQEASCDKKNIIAGVRRENEAKVDTQISQFEVRPFDFFNTHTFEKALDGIQKLILIRPPALKNTKRYILPLIEVAKQKNIQHITFLSVTNTEKSKMIPHLSVEKYIIESGIPYTIIRSGFFMQNIQRLNGNEISLHQTITMTAGNGKVNFTDIRDVVDVAYRSLDDESLRNKELEITGSKCYNFYEVAEMISKKIGKTISYTKPSAIKFIREKVKEKFSIQLIIQMSAVCNRIKQGRAEFTSEDFIKYMHREPKTLEAYIQETF